jgi:signal peptidase I
MFFDKRRRYSYAAQKSRRHRIRWILLGVLAFFVVYSVLTSLLFSMRVLENDTMGPGLRAGDRFIFSSYEIYALLPGLSIQGEDLPFRRGNVVLVDMSLRERRGFFHHVLDGVVRFFTAQRVSLNNSQDHAYLKRVIGLPGDEISMTNFVIRVKPKDREYSFTEFELWDFPYAVYDVDIPQVPALWDESLPFSGNMERIVLGEDECFVLSDDRSNTNDSRTWGPVPVSFIAGKALFRYWPFNRLGRQ